MLGTVGNNTVLDELVLFPFIIFAAEGQPTGKWQLAFDLKRERARTARVRTVKNDCAVPPG